MIRFRTIEPETAAKATPPADALPSATPQPELAPVDDSETAAKPKGLTRKAPLRAKKPDAAPLFDDEAADGA